VAEAGSMVDAASLIFMAGGALSYPVFLHLSLKKSLSIVSRENFNVRPHVLIKVEERARVINLIYY